MKNQIHRQLKDFYDFLKKRDVVPLALAFVIGNAAKDLVSSIVNNLIMPIVGIISPEGSWRQISLVFFNSEFMIGEFLGSFVDFLIIAFVVYVVGTKILKIDKSSDKFKKS